MKTKVVRYAQAIVLLAVMAFGLVWSGGTAAASAPSPVGAVYTSTNAATGNAVVAFMRNRDGSLTPAGSYATGGLGTGAGLGSQGALTFSDNRRWLFVVNAGSNEISVFAVTHDGLKLNDRVSSNGMQPISLTFSHNVLYVLNAGSSTIAGFYNRGGHLQAIPGSIQSLSQANAAPAQVQFNPAGNLLVVTEKGTNMIDSFAVNHDGVAQSGQFFPSSGMTPFGFAFDRRGRAIVSEAFGGAAGAGATSSYAFDKAGMAQVVSGSVKSGQSAPCWVIVTRTGLYAYVANTGSSSISGYRIGRDGAITLLNPDGITATTGAGTRPADLTLSLDNKYLYVLNGGTGTIGAFEIVGKNGKLRAIDGASGLIAGSAGLVAY